MIRFAAILCIGLLTIETAYADDQPDWSGSYAGAFFSGNEVGSDFDSGFGTLPDRSYDDGAAGVGLVAGYGWSTGSIYIGAEFDAQALSGATTRDARINGTIAGLSAGEIPSASEGAAFASAAGSCVGSCRDIVPGAIVGGSGTPVIIRKTGDTLEAFESRVDAAISLRARLGIQIGRFLPYVTVGPAAGHVSTQYLHLEQVVVRSSGGRVSTGVQGGFLDNSDVMFGYSLGAGTEVALTPRVSLRAEYLYSDFGKVKIEMSGRPDSTEIATSVHQGRVGLVWHF